VVRGELAAEAIAMLTEALRHVVRLPDVESAIFGLKDVNPTMT
jgi:hypothetical protein